MLLSSKKIIPKCHFSFCNKKIWTVIYESLITTLSKSYFSYIFYRYSPFTYIQRLQKIRRIYIQYKTLIRLWYGFGSIKTWQTIFWPIPHQYEWLNWHDYRNETNVSRIFFIPLMGILNYLVSFLKANVFTISFFRIQTYRLSDSIGIR